MERGGYGVFAKGFLGKPIAANSVDRLELWERRVSRNRPVF